MSDLPLKTAKSWYFEDYWLKPGFGKIHKVNATIAEELFDSGVNLGTQRTLKWLQKALNALNRQGKDYPDLVDDGIVGDKTIYALQAYLDFRGKNGLIVILRCLNALQTARYFEVADNNERLEDFFFGWILNRVTM